MAARNRIWGADRQPCHDCGVSKGELHIFGCDAVDRDLRRHRKPHGVIHEQ